MAHYTINHICGHSVEIQLLGKMEDRYRRIEWLETQECEECKRAKANAAAAAAKDARGLADLTGSEKQIAWANTIREKAYKALDFLAPYATNDKTKQIMDRWKAKMDVQTTAKWWIDNRYDLPEGAPVFNCVRQQLDVMKNLAARKIVQKFTNIFGE